MKNSKIRIFRNFPWRKPVFWVKTIKKWSFLALMTYFDLKIRFSQKNVVKKWKSMKIRIWGFSIWETRNNYQKPRKPIFWSILGQKWRFLPYLTYHSQNSLYLTLWPGKNRKFLENLWKLVCPCISVRITLNFWQM